MRQFIESMRKRRLQKSALRKPPSPSASRAPSNCEEPGVNGEEPPTSLWDRAYDALRESDQSLVGRYEELLSRELQTTGSSAIFSPWSLLPHKAPAAANPSGLKRRWDLRSSRQCD